MILSSPAVKARPIWTLVRRRIYVKDMLKGRNLKCFILLNNNLISRAWAFVGWSAGEKFIVRVFYFRCFYLRATGAQGENETREFRCLPFFGRKKLCAAIIYSTPPKHMDWNANGQFLRIVNWRDLKTAVIFIFHFKLRSVLAFFTVRPSQQRLPLERAIIASFGLILFRGFQFYNTETSLVLSSLLFWCHFQLPAN